MGQGRNLQGNNQNEIEVFGITHGVLDSRVRGKDIGSGKDVKGGEDIKGGNDFGCQKLWQVGADYKPTVAHQKGERSDTWKLVKC